MPVQLGTGPDGAMRTRYLDFVYQPLRDGQGDVAGVFVQGHDVTDVVEAGNRQKLMIDELNHRVKNLFSVVLSIVTLSGRKPSPTPEVVEDIRARIHALSLAHSTSQGAGEHSRASLRPIVARTMEPYVGEAEAGSGERVRIDGPDIDLPVRMVTPMRAGEPSGAADARLTAFARLAVPLLGPYVPK